jgi:hypothetical protein
LQSLRGKCIGIEVKRSEAPTMTLPSNRR